MGTVCILYSSYITDVPKLGLGEFFAEDSLYMMNYIAGMEKKSLASLMSWKSEAAVALPAPNSQVYSDLHRITLLSIRLGQDLGTS